MPLPTPATTSGVGGRLPSPPGRTGPSLPSEERQASGRPSQTDIESGGTFRRSKDTFRLRCTTTKRKAVPLNSEKETFTRHL